MSECVSVRVCVVRVFRSDGSGDLEKSRVEASEWCNITECSCLYVFVMLHLTC